jgi:thymidylate synthase (FAD)
MRLVRSSFELIDDIDPISVYKKIEKIGRVCYKSEDKITETSHEVFIKNLLKRQHLAMIEHVNITGKFICDRGVSHELVRHRLCSFAQESTRYCNYKGGVTFVIPSQFKSIPEREMELQKDIKFGELLSSWLGPICPDEGIESGAFDWLWSMSYSEDNYLKMLRDGCTPQQARAVLPNSLKTEIVVTANLREWLYIFSLRLPSTAHPDMRDVMKKAYNILNEKLPLFFNEETVKF